MTVSRVLAFILCFAAAACGAKPPPACPDDGPVRQLNTGRWTPLPGDLDPPSKGVGR